MLEMFVPLLEVHGGGGMQLSGQSEGLTRKQFNLSYILGARTLLGAPGRTTSNKKLLGAPCAQPASKGLTATMVPEGLEGTAGRSRPGWW